MNADARARSQLTLFPAVSITRAGTRDARATCFECGVDVVEIGEYFMVTDDVWLVACPWNADGGMFDFLCVGCLEARIGRPLAREDFTDCPLNRFPGGSPRLRARIIGVAA